VSEKTDIIENILDFELKMFLSVKSRHKASCQEHPDSFRINRKAQFLAWSEKTLNCYLKDLQEADRKGVNMMTQKYARMENLIPKLKDNPLMESIIEIQYKWQNQMFDKYPNLMGGARSLSSTDDTSFGTSFETYMRGELETYSDETLASLHKDLLDKVQEGENMTEELYSHLVLASGYSSLEDAEAIAKKNRG